MFKYLTGFSICVIYLACAEVRATEMNANSEVVWEFCLGVDCPVSEKQRQRCDVVVPFAQGTVLVATDKLRETKRSRQLPSFREVCVWSEEEIFTSAEGLGIAQAISRHDHDALKELLEAGSDASCSGKSGITPLYWALMTDDMTAFRILLEFGANPDARLAGFVPLRFQKPFRLGDSILFTCLRKKKYDYFFLALRYSTDVKQVDGEGDTLLLAHVGPGVSPSVELLQQMIDKGVPLDAKSRNGSTACQLAVIWDRPGLALRMLQVGADAAIPTAGGGTIYGLVENRVAHHDKRGNGRILKKFRLLKEWLESNCGEVIREDKGVSLSLP